MQKIDYKSLIRRALKEDLHSTGDITSKALFSGQERAVFTLLAKDSGILCGIEMFKEVFYQVDKKIIVQAYYDDGDRIESGKIVARVSGKLTAILTAERTALNILCHLCGIATKTAEFVAIAGSKVRILDTRKTIPGLRDLQKYAVKTGGGTNHRFGLFDMIMIKDNHIDASGGITPAVQKVRAKWGNRYKIEVETRTIAEVTEALAVHVDRIMLDNMDNQTMTEALAIIQGKTETEASGNMSIQRLQTIADSGIDFVSFGELTHTVRVFDFSLKQEKML